MTLKFEDLGTALKKLRDDIVKTADQTARRSVKEDFAGGAPVDTGYFKSTMQYSVNRTPKADIGEAGPKAWQPYGTKDMQIMSANSLRAQSQVDARTNAEPELKPGQRAYIHNDTPYGIFIEYGSPKTTPEATARIAFAKLAERIPDDMDKMLKQEWK